MNKLYQDFFLLSGDYDSEARTINYDRRRHQRNNFIEYLGYFSFSITLSLFFIDDTKFGSMMVYLTILKISSKGFGHAYVNLTFAFALFFTTIPMQVYKQLHKHPERFSGFRFLFCSTTEKMQSEFGLERSLANRQILFQKIYFRQTRFWNR